MRRVYTAEAPAHGPSTGKVATSDDPLDLELSRPKAMGGDDGPGTNPEQLFAAGYAACFHSAMRHGVRSLGLPPDSLQGARVTAQVHFHREDPTNFQLAVDLHARLPKLDREQARAVVEKTHTICPYSKATAGNIDVHLHVV